MSVAAALALAGLQSANAQDRAVDLRLVLAIDCSYSVDDTEYTQQALGLAAAFVDPEVLRAIGLGPNRAIAVSVMQWSHFQSPLMAIPWTRIDGPASAARLAGRLERMQRITEEGGTSYSGAIRFAMGLFDAGPYQSRRKVIDISSDGRNNNGAEIGPIRQLALLKGFTINGLAILNEHPTLDYYFRQQVIGGAGSFVIKAENYVDYADAIRRKLIKEITIVPIARAETDTFEG